MNYKILVVLVLGLTLFATGVMAYIVFVPITSSDNTEVEHRTFSWCSDNEPYSVEFDIPMSDLEGYNNAKVFRDLNVISTSKFVTDDDTTIKSIGKQIAEQTKDDTMRERANVVLDFVQDYVIYSSDQDKHGQNEYYQFPLETLYDRSGDCDDVSFLLSSIYKSMGYDVILKSSTDHCVVGVNCNDTDGTSVSLFGTTYLIADATGWQDVGVGEQEGIYYPPSNLFMFVIFAIALSLFVFMIWCSKQLLC